jgi:hypothetical protein
MKRNGQSEHKQWHSTGRVSRTRWLLCSDCVRINVITELKVNSRGGRFGICQFHINERVNRFMWLIEQGK